MDRMNGAIGAESARKPVTLTVRHQKGGSARKFSVELPEGTPIAGVTSAVMEIDDTGTPVLTIKIRNFSVDASDTEAKPYRWHDFSAPALNYQP